MDLELTDKVAIVGGASKGLGRACAEVLAEEGCRVVICSRSGDDLEKAAKDIRSATGRDVLVFAGDLDRPETIRGLVAATVERFGRLDVLVNNSGGPPLAQAQTASEEQWATAVERSLFFFGRMCREALPHLKAAGAGRIINILASTVYQPIPNLVLSGVTRMGVVAFAKRRWPSARPRPRWAAWASRGSWPTWWPSSPRASRATSPGPRSWWTAGSCARSCRAKLGACRRRPAPPPRRR